MKRLARWLALTGLAFVVGLGLSFVVIGAFGLILPPFRPEDDDTIRDYGPVLTAYAVWDSRASSVRSGPGGGFARATFTSLDLGTGGEPSQPDAGRTSRVLFH